MRTLVLALLLVPGTAADAQWASRIWSVADDGRVFAHDLDGTAVTVRPGIGAGPTAIARRIDGSVVVTMSATSGLYRTNALGTIQTTYAAGAAPTDLAFDPTGAVWVNQAGGGVLQLAADGTVMQSIYPSGTTRVTALAAGGNGRLWLADAEGALHCYTTAGVPVGAIATAAPSVTDVAVDANGACWAVNDVAGVVTKYDATATRALATIRMTAPDQVAINGNDEIYVLSTTTLGYYSSVGASLAQTALPSGRTRGLAIDGNGDLWTARDNQLLKYDRWSLQPLATVTIANASHVRINGDATGWTVANTLLPATDLDADLVTNNAEIAAGANPFTPSSTPATPQPIVSGPVRVGEWLRIAFRQPSDALLGFAAAGAMSDTIGIPIPRDPRRIPLDNDAFYAFVLGAVDRFTGFGGWLDVQGQATGRVRVPSDPRLAGTTWLFAFVTLDPTRVAANRTPIETISSSIRVTVGP